MVDAVALKVTIFHRAANGIGGESTARPFATETIIIVTILTVIGGAIRRKEKLLVELFQRFRKDDRAFVSFCSEWKQYALSPIRRSWFWMRDGPGWSTAASQSIELMHHELAATAR